MREDALGSVQPSQDAAVKRAQLGDRQALAELYTSLAPDVRRLCQRLLGSQEADDAQHEVFLRVQRAFASYDPQRPLRRWLLAVAAHHCIDQLRRRQHEGRLFEASDLDTETLPSHAPTPLAAFLEREAREALLRALHGLSDRHRVPLVLRHYADLSYQEISDVLGVTRAQVGTLLFRSRVALREAFLRWEAR